MSFGVTQGISPSQKAGLSRWGVPPPFDLTKWPTLLLAQCAGTSPIHSTPESFIGTSGSSPLVTACVMTACRFSSNSSMNRCFFSISVSMRVVSRSRKVAIWVCSWTLGIPIRMRDCSPSLSDGTAPGRINGLKSTWDIRNNMNRGVAISGSVVNPVMLLSIQQSWGAILRLLREAAAPILAQQRLPLERIRAPMESAFSFDM